MLQRNFTLLKWISAFRFYNVLLPFYLIYAHQMGLSYQQIFETQIVFAISLIFLTLPGGVFSDLFGRRLSLMCGSTGYFIAGLFFLFWKSFLGFSLGEVALAFSYALFSGSDSALLYESAKSLNQLDRYLQQESTVHAYARVGESISGLSGGILATFNLIFLSIFPVVSAIPLMAMSFFLKEASPVKLSVTAFKRKLFKKTQKQLWHVRYFLFSKSKRTIQLTIVYSALISCMTLSAFWLFQAFIDQHKLSYIHVGIVWLVYQLVTGLASNYAPLIIRACKKTLLVILPMLLIVMAVVLYHFSASACFILVLIAAITFGIKMPLIYYLLNNALPSASRVSVLSLDSLLTRLFFSALAMVLGTVLDHQGVNQAFGVLLIPGVLALLCSGYLFKKNVLM